MASLRRLPDSPYWIACFSLPDGRQTQRSTKTTSRAEALRIAIAFEDASKLARAKRLTESQARKVITDIYAMSSGDRLASSSIHDFLESWLKRKSIETDERTHERYTTAINHFFHFFGERTARDICHLSSKDIANLRDHLAEKLSANSANYTLKVLRAALNQARRDGLVDTNEAHRVTLIAKVKKFRRKAFTLEQLRKVLEVAEGEWRGMILIGLYTGLRLGDIALLTWGNFDLVNEELLLTTQKTDDSQAIPFAKPLSGYLRSLTPLSSDSPVFPNAFALKTRNSHGGPLSNQFYEILTSAGLAIKRDHKARAKGRDGARKLNPLSFHSLRHTATSLLKNAGVSDVVARDIIGHESAAVAATYTHIDTATKREALNRMPDIVGRSQQ